MLPLAARCFCILTEITRENKIVTDYYLCFVGLDGTEGRVYRQDCRVGVLKSPLEVDRQTRQVAYTVRPGGRGVDAGRLEVHHAVIVQRHFGWLL